MAYSDSFPAIRPSFQFSADAGRLDSRITFSRSDTPPTYAAPSAVHYWSNEKHLSSENLLTYSNPNDAAWSESGSTVTLNQAASPDGNTTASLITEDSSTGLHRTLLSTPVNSGDSLTVVGYLKANGRTIVQVGQTGVYGTSNWVEFDLSGSGTATTREGSPTGVTIAQVGSTGWYKVSYSSTTSSSGTHYTQIKLCDAANSDTYTGDNSSGVYAYGFNLSSIGQLVHEDTSGQRARQYAPTLKSVSYAGQPRFEYSPTDSASMGLLIEGSSTNLVTRSSELNAAFWNTFTTANIDANVAVSIDGTLTADLIRPTTATSGHYVQTNAAVTTVDASTYTLSAYVKAAGLTKTRLYFIRASSPYTTAAYGLFTLTGDGSVEDVQGSATISPVGNGWYRISVTGAAVTTLTTLVVQPTDASGTATFAGDGYSGILCTGVQFELGSHCSSLISTSGSAVTRAADSASVDLSAINQDPIGTDIALATEFRCNVVDTNFRRIAEMRRSSGSGLHKSHQVYNGTAYSYATDTSGTNQVLKSIVSLGDTSHKLVSTQSGASAFAAGDGVAGNTKTSTAKDMVYDRLYIGSDLNGIRQLDGHISRVALYGNSISETNATALSS